MKDDRWEPHGAGYKQMRVADKGDNELLESLDYAIDLAAKKKSYLPQYRQWRRMLVREALKRGLIDKDPGSPP